MANIDVLFQHGMRNLESVAVGGVHFDAVDQLVSIGKGLLAESLFKSHDRNRFHLLGAFILSAWRQDR